MLKLLAVCILVAPATTALAQAQSSSGAYGAAPPADPVWTVEATGGVVSDYRFRGYSLSGGAPALQASLTVSHASGVFANVSASSIEEYGVDADGNGARVELTGSVGWRGRAGELDVEGSISSYRYPGAEAVDYVEIPIQAGRTFGALTTTAGLAYAPGQRALGDADNLYRWVALEWAPDVWPVSLSGRIGYEHGAFAQAGKTDWEVALSRPAGAATLGLSWTDSNRAEGAWVASVFLAF